MPARAPEPAAAATGESILRRRTGPVGIFASRAHLGASVATRLASGRPDLARRKSQPCSTAASGRKRNRGRAPLKPSGTPSVWSRRGDEAPGDSGAVVTDLSVQPVRQGVDLDVILCRDSELCDQRQDRAN